MSYSILWLTVVVVFAHSVAVGAQCPVLQEDRSPNILSNTGLRLYIDLNDEELKDTAPPELFQFSDNGIIDIIEDAEVNNLFAIREFSQLIPAILSSLVKTIPFHINLTNSSASKVYFSLSIISLDDSGILGPFNEVSPNGIAITPGIVTDVSANFCCKGVGSVLLEGCLTIAKEPFDNVTAGPYTTIGPFFANYECQEQSLISNCPSSMEVAKAKVQLCFPSMQAQALVTQPEWQLLIGGAESFCALTTTTLQVRIFLQSRDRSKEVPLSADFDSLDYYFDRAIIKPLVWTSPTYYFLTVIPDDLTVIEQVNLSIPLEGSFDSDTLDFSMFFPCLTNGATFLVFTMNTSGLVENYVVNNTFTFYLYKICMPFNETNRVPVHHGNSKLSVIIPSSLSAGIVVIIVVVSLTVIIVGVYSKMKKRQLVNLEELAMSTNAPFNAYTVTAGFSPFDFLEDVDDLEYNFAALELEEKLGEGFFGNVYKAKAPGILRRGHEVGEFVAVKTLKGDSNADALDEFAKELKLCLRFDHPHVIKLLGVCTESIQKCMIFEYMDLGSLDNCLRSSNPSDPLYNPTNFTITKKDFLPIVIQLAKGVEYLSSLSITHRDLAARNCLMNSKLIAKIADFGLSRNLDAQNYYKVGGAGGSLPIRWMPPEAILYRKFTPKSDVWSFGVLMWEVYTFGKLPYTGLSNHEVIDAIREHKVLYQPGGCPVGVYDIMNNCWIKVPAYRPGITQIISQLEGCRTSYN